MSAVKLTVVEALNEVMKTVGHIAKNEKNEAQGFKFRGIDSIVNAVSPALQLFGVVVVPCVKESEYSSIVIGSRQTTMGLVRVRVTYTFIGPAGDTIEATVIGEAMDAGDKASTKAMSVAFRTALLQSLCLPTGDIEPDSQSYERIHKVDNRNAIPESNSDLWATVPSKQTAEEWGEVDTHENPSRPSCSHGPMLSQGGVSAAGKKLPLWKCSEVDRDSQCKAIWA